MDVGAQITECFCERDEAVGYADIGCVAVIVPAHLVWNIKCLSFALDVHLKAELLESLKAANSPG